jgi:hypothetical protein
MTRLRYNDLQTVLSGTLSNVATTLPTLTGALTYNDGTTVPTLTGSDYIPLSVLDTDGRLAEIVHLTAYNSGTLATTILRAREGTTAQSHAAGAVVMNTINVQDLSEAMSSPAGSGAIIMDPRWLPRSGETVVDDFLDSTIDAAYTRVDESGKAGDVAWAEAGGVLSLVHDNMNSDGSTKWHAQMRPLSGAGGTMVAGDAFVFSQKVAPQNQGNIIFAGLILADGTTYGSGTQLMGLRYADSGTQFTDISWLEKSTGYNTHVSMTGAEPTRLMKMTTWHQRLAYLGSNLWRLDTSLDGVQWMKDGNTLSEAFTPTHVGFGTTNNTASCRYAASWQYLRRVAGVT